MGIYKDESRGTWYVKTYYTDWTGQKKQKLKRGFKLQREAKEWERDFLLKQAAQPSMPFRALSELYLEDKKAHTKLITYETKKNRIDKWLLPFFSDKPVDTITAADINQEEGTLTVNKTYHLINGKGLTTPPKTEKANRTITLPPFLLKCIKRHISRLYAADSSTRLFMASHSTYARQMELHTKQAGVRRIRLHDLRHSHASLLIELGFSALLVSERLGHENVSTTLNIYSHLFPSKQSEVSERLEKLCEKDQY